MSRKTDIIIHCTATPPSWMDEKTPQEKTDEIKRWHMKDRGWRDIGYAYVIDRDGTVVKGRDLDDDGNVWEEIGAHTKGHNTRSIGIALVGGHGSSENDNFHDHFTVEQNRSIRKLIAELQEILGPLKLSGHNEYAAKACPGFKVREWFEVKPARGRLESGTAQGNIVAGAGLTGTVATDMIAAELQTAAAEAQGLLQYAPALKWVFIGLTLTGIGYSLWRRIGRDWARGRQ